MNIKALRIFYLLLTLCFTTTSLQAQIVRVNANSTCVVGCDGSTWALAYTSLKTALDSTTLGEIWVAQGTYTPDASNRDSSFVLKSGLAIYGGFNGTETLRNQRDYINNTTILSGDLSGNDGANFTNYSDNSYHVIRATKVNNTAILDGFTVRGGNADDIAFPDYIGGGLYNDGQGAGNSSTPIVQNCHFTENFADRSGGAIFNYGGTSGNANMSIFNTQFTFNKADDDGGALYNDGQGLGTASPTVEGCFFAANTATNGGAIYNYGGAVGNANPTIVNCLITGNVADRGAGMYNDGSAVGNSNGNIVNCTFSGNQATTEGSAVFNFGGFGGSSSPIFTNCVFWDNSTPTDTSSIHNSDATPFINYSLIEETTCPGINSTCDANTIFNQDPQFLSPITAAAPTTTGDLRYIPCSPLRDAGDNATINATGFTLDFLDSNRIYTNIVDIGAYEFNNNPVELVADAVISSNYNGAAITCPGASDASIDLTLSGGVLPYVFGWDNGIGAVEDPANLAAGTYIITVTDGNNCFKSDTVIISDPDSIQSAIVATSNFGGFNVSCPGATDGVVDLTVTGGVGGYTYLWSYNALTSEDPNTLPSGKHYVTITDLNGCTKVDSITLTEPVGMTANAVVSSNFNGFDISCVGATDGMIDLTVTDGTAPYTYAWSGGLGNSEDPINVAAGTYTVTVTDLNGCTVTTSVTLNPPTVLIANVVVSSNYNGADVTCIGANDGSINLTASGGAPNYSYNWDNGIGATEDPTNLTAGTYNVTVTDANGCTATNSITLNDPTAITANAVVSSNYNGQDISCNGGNDGAINLTASGGSGILTYNWDNGIGAIEDPSGLVAGIYNVTITDANGCTQTTNITLNEPTPVTANAIITTNYNGFDVSCAGANDGAADLTAGGGTPNYTYLWDNGIGAIEDPNTLDTGTYNVTVTDANGCIATTSITLSGPAGLDLTIAVSSNFNGEDISCVGANDGAIDLTVNGGIAPFTYTWDNGIGNIQDPNGLTAGNYNVTVTDANGCSNQTSITLNDPPALSATLMESTSISCNGGSNGAINLTANGGVAPYSYNWDNGIGATEDPSGLAAGTYNVTVTDANGCTATNSITLNDPTAITANAVVSSNYNGQDISCNGGNDGAIDLTASGGTGILTYNWDNGIGATEDPSGLVAGIYNVTITDANGCTQTTNITLNEPTPVTANAVITSNFNGFDVSCAGANDGAADLTAGGGTPNYTYLWDNGIGAIEDPNTLDTGTYNVTVTDANGCIATTSLTLSGPAGLDLTIAVSSNFNGEDISCVGANDGAIDLTVNGGVPPFTYTWDNGIGNIQDPNGLTAGNYNVTVTDANGCSNQTSITLNAPPALSATLTESTSISCNGGSNGAIDLTANGGVAPYSYNWDNGIGATEDPSGLAAGTYNVTVTDANGCTFTNSITLNEPADLTANIIITSNYNGFDVSCNTGNDGAVDLTANGGTAPYSYNWDNGIGAIEDPNNLSPTTYTVTVTDANGCTEITSITLTAPAALNLNAIVTSNFNGVNVSCIGANDGAADLTVNGGVPNYTYQWSNNTTLEDPNNLDTGMYQVVVTDLNGCIDSTTITLTGPVPIAPTAVVSSNFNGSDVSCVGASDGAIDLTVNGGTAPYNYNWNSGLSTNEDLNNIPSGTYSVVVTDANGCQDSTNIQLDDPMALTLTLAIDTSILCNGNTTGAINTTVSGGTGIYNYNWNNGIPNVEDPNNLVAGNYIITVSDGNNCTIVDSISLTEPTVLTILATADTLYNGFEISCTGANDGGIDLTVNGGTAPYTYLWSTNDTIQNLDSLVAGIYSITVTDSLGCQMSTSITLNEPTALTASATHINPTCLGINNGSIDLTVNGGIPIYTYNWDNGIGNTEDPMNITAGIFTVTITDQNNCTSTLSDTLTGNTNPFSISGTVISNYNGQQISCPDSTDGNIDVTASPVGAYSYNWSNGLPNSEDQFNLGAGTYSVTATDVNGCFDTTSITITPPPTITTNISVFTNYNGSGISCNGASDAALDLTVNGGIAPYLYLWSNSAVVEDPTGIDAGNTSVIVTDQNGCTANDTIFLNQPTAITSSIVITSNFNGNAISCLGATDGAVDLTVSGGIGAYTYLWSNGDTIQDISNLGAGTYSVTITDINGCQDSTQVTIQAPVDGIQINANSVGDICANTNNGIITINVTGGAGNYIYNWNNSLPNTQNQSNLSSGTYTVTVTDAIGCLAIDTIVIGTLPTPIADISADSVCVGLMTTFFDNSNAPTGSAYAWDFQNDGIIDDNTVGTTAFQYPTNGIFNTQLIITSSDGCRDTANIDVLVEELVVSFSGLALEYCPNDTIVPLIGIPAGGIFSGNGIISDTIFDPSQAPVGTNTISYTYTNTLGCSETISQNVQILPLPNLDAGDDITGTVNTPIQLEAIGAFSYEWSPATGLDNPFVAAPTALLFETQTYTVTGTAGNGCSTTDEITVTIDNDINCLKLRTVFSPNGDGINETWSIECISYYDNTVEVYNRWGQLVFQAENYSNTWTGISLTGEELPEDSYFYVVTITNQGYENIFKGSVTIVR